MAHIDARALVEDARQNIAAETGDGAFIQQSEAIKRACKQLMPGYDSSISGPFKAIAAREGNCLARMAHVNMLKPPSMDCHMLVDGWCNGEPHFAALVTKGENGLLLNKAPDEKFLRASAYEPADKDPLDMYINRLQKSQAFLGVFAIYNSFEGWDTIVLENSEDAESGREAIGTMESSDSARLIVPMDIGRSLLSSFPNGIQTPDQYTNRPEPAKIKYMDDMLKALEAYQPVEH